MSRKYYVDLPPDFFAGECPITRGKIELDLEDRSLRRIIRMAQQDAPATEPVKVAPWGLDGQ